MHVENISIYRGDTYAFDISIVSDDGSPLDLTGAAVAMAIAPKGDYVPFSPDIDVEGNVITITIQPHHTQGATWRSAEYDVQITQGNAVTTVLRGRIDMTQDITQ